MVEGFGRGDREEPERVAVDGELVRGRERRFDDVGDESGGGGLGGDGREVGEGRREDAGGSGVGGEVS